MSARRAGENVEVQGADTGTGILDTDREHVFEGFFRGTEHASRSDEEAASASRSHERRSRRTADAYGLRPVRGNARARASRLRRSGIPPRPRATPPRRRSHSRLCGDAGARSLPRATKARLNVDSGRDARSRTKYSVTRRARPRTPSRGLRRGARHLPNRSTKPSPAPGSNRSDRRRMGVIKRGFTIASGEQG
jgi:hypothetical protein